MKSFCLTSIQPQANIRYSGLTVFCPHVSTSCIAFFKGATCVPSSKFGRCADQRYRCDLYGATTHLSPPPQSGSTTSSHRLNSLAYPVSNEIQYFKRSATLQSGILSPGHSQRLFTFAAKRGKWHKNTLADRMCNKSFLFVFLKRSSFVEKMHSCDETKNRFPPFFVDGRQRRFRPSTANNNSK